MLSLVSPTIAPVRVPTEQTYRKDSHKEPHPVLKITYRYADAGNGKYWGEFHILGAFKFETLEPYLFDKEFFVPERIDLPSLVPTIRNRDDHLLHTFEDFAADEVASYLCTAEELLGRVRLANEESWFAGIY